MRWAIFLLSLSLAASESHGVVKFGGLPVPGATVTAAWNDRKITAVTGFDGVYSFPDLADGRWSVQVDMLCFSTLRREIDIASGAPPQEWELAVLPFGEIRAMAPAPAPPSVKFQRTVLKASGSASSSAPENAPEAGAGEPNPSASDSFSINGSQNNGALSPFAQSQAFGNNRRSAGSLYNGSISLSFDNSALDARSFSLTGQDTAKPAYNRLQGGIALGGPVIIPHLIDTSAPANFFIAYQIMRNRNASEASALMPTAAEREGDLTGLTIPQSRISPQATALLSLYPLPNFAPNARYNYQVPLTGYTNQDSLQSRLTKNFGRYNQIFGALAYQNTRMQNLNVFGFRDTSGIQGIDIGVNWSHRFNQRAFTTARYQFTRLSTRVTPYFSNRENISGEAGIGGNNQEPVNWGPPSLSFSSGVATLSDVQQSLDRNQTSAVSDTTYWSHAPHNLTFGGDFKRQQFNALSQQDARGSFTFNGAATGSDFADFLLGIPDTSSIAFGNADKYFRASLYDAFITDDWRVSPSLTVNAGLRWEYGSPISERYGRLVNLDIVPGFGAEAPVVASNPVGALTHSRYPGSLVQPDKHAFQPRIGIAWRPIAGSSMVIRAGYGVNYNTSVYQAVAARMAQQSPLSKSLAVQNTAADPLTLADAFNTSPGVTPNTFAIDPNFRIGYAQTWQASVQRDLAGSLVMTATYLGIKGTRAVQEFLPNTYPAGAANPCPACPTGFDYMTSNGNSTREAGQLQLRRRLHNGITATLQYVYAKAIDDAALGGRGQGTPVIAQNWLDLSAERGPSNFDQRHLLTLQAQYTSGMGIGGGTLLSGWRGGLLREWTFASQITAGSGLPLTPVYLTAVNGTGITGSIRPDYAGQSIYAAPAGFFLNPAAFRAPVPGEWGNAGRDSITGPSQFVMNASLARTFRLRDRYSLDLRFDSTNVLNHVSFPNWNTLVTSAQFGLPTQANAMRNVQANLRVRF